MRAWVPDRVAAAAGARLVQPPPAGTAGPSSVVIDSRQAAPGTLFVGLAGRERDGGAFAARALAAGAWGVLVAPGHADAARCAPPGVLLAAEDPLAALGHLARAWRRELGASVIAVTGSTGKTSTKDILAAMLAPARHVRASPENYNTEIGVPLAILGAEPGTEVLVLELAMRGAGQIAELTTIAEPDVAVIVNVGPVHLELLGSLDAIAAAKAELIRDMPGGGAVVVPAGEPLLERHLRDDLATITFGPGGDVELAAAEGEHVEIAAGGERFTLRLSFTQEHNRRNALAAFAAARAIGVTPAGRVEPAFSALRGQRLELPWAGGALTVVNDCYNANPMSMRAALEDLAASPTGPAGASTRRVAVLGDMLELGADERAFHTALGPQAEAAGVALLLTVGPLAALAAEGFDGEAHAVADAAEAAALLPDLLAPGDAILVKASRGIGLEVVAEALAARSRSVARG